MVASFSGGDGGAGANTTGSRLGEVIETARHQVRGLLRAIYRFVRRREETAAMKQTRTTVAERWAEFRDYLIELAGRYEATYAQVAREREAAAAAAAAGATTP